MNSYKSKFKEYPEHRVCVIDFLPIVEQSVKDTYAFFLNLNVPTSFFTKNKKDVLNVFYHYFLTNASEAYNKCSSKYRKVIATYDINSQKHIPAFFKERLSPALKVCPIDWCKISSLASPDVGIAAATSLEKKKETYSKLFKFANDKQLNALKNKIKKSRAFSNILVDFSTVQE